MTNYEVAKEVLAYCGRCKLQLAHVIMSLKKTDAINKVQCKTCQSVHSFKDAQATPKKVKTLSTLERVRRDNSLKNAKTWEERIRGKETKTYSIKLKFHINDVINHLKFGMGIVEEIVDDTKILVTFFDGQKILVHNRL